MSDVEVDESQYADDVKEDAIVEVSGANLSLGEMCLKAIELLDEQARLAARQAVVAQELRIYTENLIPGVLAQMKLKDLTTASGLSIELCDEIYATLPKDDRRERAFEYLRSNGEGGLIRTEFEVGFGVGTDEDAQRFADLIRQAGIDKVADVQASRTINHAQMMKFLREQRKIGANVPMSAFGAGVRTFAKIKLVR